MRRGAIPHHNHRATRPVRSGNRDTGSLWVPYGRFYPLVCALAFILVVAAAPVWAIDLPPSQDVYDNSDSANKNYGSKSSIRINNVTEEQKSSYLQFAPYMPADVIADDVVEALLWADKVKEEGDLDLHTVDAP